jgi:uncharacterized cupredoxin-like copper-binding protein
MRLKRRGTAAAALLAVAAAVVVLSLTAAASPPPERTVYVTIHFSHFDLASLQVSPGETVRFVVTNTDPIDHEFLVGDAQMQQIHELGTEASHGARPGEISVPAGATVSTTFTFPDQLAPGWEFACHLPGHYAYGMHGPITITT